MASEAVTTDSYSHVKACTVGNADTIIRSAPGVGMKSVVAVRNALLLEPVHPCCTATVTLQHFNTCAKRGHRCHAESCSEFLSSVYDARVCKRIVSCQPNSSWVFTDSGSYSIFTEFTGPSRSHTGNIISSLYHFDNYEIWFMNCPIGVCTVMGVKNKTTVCGIYLAQAGDCSCDD
jgi:hypothetical protein